jgi:hypothetical protein
MTAARMTAPMEAVPDGGRLLGDIGGDGAGQHLTAPTRDARHDGGGADGGDTKNASEAARILPR